MSAVREVLLGENVQAALNAGPGEVVLEADRNNPYTLSAPLVMPRGVNLRGANHGAILKAALEMDAVVKVGDVGSIDHWAISGLTVDGNELATTGIDVNIVGTSGNYKSGEPDSRGRISDVEVWDTVTNGVWTRGSDAQAIRFQGIRVRKAGVYGFRVESPDLWFTDCEATTDTGSSDTNRPGAGFGVYSSNCHFDRCKAWYTRSHGFHVKGTRNFFMGCEAQDTAKHGYFIEWDKNNFVGCVADTCSATPVGGTANTHDGFYVTPVSKISMVGCMSFDRQPSGTPIGQRHGFNLSSSLDPALFVGNTAWGVVGSPVHYR